MAEVHACWKTCNDLAQQEENRDKLVGISKGVLVSNWDASIAEMPVEEKAMPDKHGAIFMRCLSKAHEDKDQRHEAPELK